MSGTGNRARERRCDPFVIKDDVLGNARIGASVNTAARFCSLLVVYRIIAIRERTTARTLRLPALVDTSDKAIPIMCEAERCARRCPGSWAC